MGDVQGCEEKCGVKGEVCGREGRNRIKGELQG